MGSEMCIRDRLFNWVKRRAACSIYEWSSFCIQMFFFRLDYPYLIPVLACLAAAAFIVLIAILIWSYRRRKKDCTMHGETFFRKEKNILTSVTSNVHEKTKNFQQQPSKASSICKMPSNMNGQVSRHILAPDKVFLHESGVTEQLETNTYTSQHEIHL